MDATVYALIDPRDRRFFYIGMSSDPARELRQMRAHSSHYGKKVRARVEEIEARGYEVEWEPLYSESEGCKEEWIKLFTAHGLLIHYAPMVKDTESLFALCDSPVGRAYAIVVAPTQSRTPWDYSDRAHPSTVCARFLAEVKGNKDDLVTKWQKILLLA